MGVLELLDLEGELGGLVGVGETGEGELLLEGRELLVELGGLEGLGLEVGGKGGDLCSEGCLLVLGLGKLLL